MKKILFPGFLFFSVLVAPVHAQPVSDAGLWSTFSIEKDISRKITLGLDEEFRLKQNFSMLNLFYTNVGVGYKPVKWLKLGLTYRLIEKWRYEYQFVSYRHRLMFDAILKYKKAQWRFSYRSRVQSELRDIYSSEKGKVPEWFWRNKIDIKYELQQFIPYAGTEFRYQISDPREPESDRGWHRVRTYAGCDYAINDQNTVGLYYLIQREFSVAEPQFLYIIGIQYTITLASSK